MTSELVETPEAIAEAISKRAAVVGVFDPSRLLTDVAPGQHDERAEDRIFSVLSASIEEVVIGKNVLWRLNPEARRQILGELVAGGELDRTIALTKPQEGDRFGQILQATLKKGAAGSSGYLQRMSTDDLMLQALALDFTQSLRVQRAAVQPTAMDPRILLARQAERRRQDYVAPAKLFGRDYDSEALDRYITDGSINLPLVRLQKPADAPLRLRPLLLTGIGGSGKSALVADLTRRTQRQDWSGPIVVSLDFDQKNIALGGEREWLNELTRQIGLARPKLNAALSKVRSEARQHLHRLTQQRDDVDRLTGTDNLLVVSTMREDLQNVLSDGGLAAETLVIIVDTFEEVLVRSNMKAETISQELFGLVLAFLDSLSQLASPNGSAAFGAIRAVVAGRAHPFPDRESVSANWFEAHLEVGELDVDAAIEFIRARSNRRVFTKARARRIVETLPRYPLVLILLAAFAGNRPANEIDEVVGSAQGAGVLSAAASTRVLYSRFLDRLKDHTVRDGKGERLVPRSDLARLAHPGLALSVVTPVLIRHVLAGPTGLGDIDDQRAEDLFEALSREVWLVESVGTNAVRHIPVLRRIMLPMLNGDLRPSENANIAMRETVRAVHLAAAAWYRAEGAAEPNALALAAYHDAFVGEVRALASDPSLVRRVLDIAGEDVSAMPIEARAILRREALSDEALSAEESASLPAEQRSTVDAARGSRRTRSGIVSRNIYSDFEPDSANFYIEAIAPFSKIESVVRPIKRKQIEILQDREVSQRIESSFAEADFDGVLRHGRLSVEELRDAAQDEPPFDRLGDVTSHWTWKWALSSLALGEGDETLLNWAVESPQHANAPSSSPPFHIGALISLAIATVALGRAPSFCTEPPYRIATMIYPVVDTGPIRSVLSMRLQALSRYWGQYQPETKRPFIEVRPDVLRLVELWSRVRATKSDQLGGSISVAQIPASLRRHFSRFEIEAPLSSDFRILDENEGFVVFPTDYAMYRPAQSRVMPARSPELYDPVRAAFGDVAASDPSSFADAITEIAPLAPFWPADLAPHYFLENAVRLRETDYLLARLVVFLDLAGLSSQLFAALERRTSTGKRFQAVAKLVHAYEMLLQPPSEVVGHLSMGRFAEDSSSGSAT